MTLTAVPAIKPTNDMLPSEGPHPRDVKCPLHPAAGFVAYVREQPPEKSKGGLYLPQLSAEEKAREEATEQTGPTIPLPCFVTAVGDEIENITVPCGVGDRVLTGGPVYSMFEDEWFVYEIVAFSGVTAIVDPPEAA